MALDTKSGDAVLRNPHTGKPVLAPDGRPIDTSPGRMGELVDLMGEWGNKDVNAMTPAERQIMSEFTRNVQGMFGTRQDSGSTGKPPGTGQEPTPPQDVDDNTFGAPEQKKPNNRSPRDSDENFQHILRYMQNASDRLREFFENLPPDIFKGPPPGGGGAAPVPGRGRRLQRRRR